MRNALITVSDAVLGAAVLVFLGVLLGGWLDQKMNTAPWLSLTLSIVFGGLGLWRMVKKAMELDTGPSPSTGSGKSASGESESDSNEDA